MNSNISKWAHCAIGFYSRWRRYRCTVSRIRRSEFETCCPRRQRSHPSYDLSVRAIVPAFCLLFVFHSVNLSASFAYTSFLFHIIFPMLSLVSRSIVRRSVANFTSASRQYPHIFTRLPIHPSIVRATIEYLFRVVLEKIVRSRSHRRGEAR